VSRAFCPLRPCPPLQRGSAAEKEEFPIGNPRGPPNGFRAVFVRARPRFRRTHVRQGEIKERERERDKGRAISRSSIPRLFSVIAKSRLSRVKLDFRRSSCCGALRESPQRLWRFWILRFCWKKKGEKKREGKKKGKKGNNRVTQERRAARWRVSSARHVCTLILLHLPNEKPDLCRPRMNSLPGTRSIFIIG